MEIADALKVKGLVPLACKTDRIDSWVLAELSRPELLLTIWLPDPDVRAERERARYRLHLVRHRTMFKNRVHAALVAFGKPCPVFDLFSLGGRELLGRLGLPEPWNANLEAASLTLTISARRSMPVKTSSGPWGRPIHMCGCSRAPRASAGCSAAPSPRRSRHRPVLRPEESRRIHRPLSAGPSVRQQ